MSRDPDTYGRLNVLANPAAAGIWRTRHLEPDACEPFWLASDYIAEDNSAERVERQWLWDLVRQNVNPKEWAVLSMRYRRDMTYQEVGHALGLTGARIRQIEMKALRWLRYPPIANALYPHRDWRSLWPIKHRLFHRKLEDVNE
jgi:hypothetical protein